MTQLFIVMMRDGVNHRWPDSYWISMDGATRRVEQLQNNLAVSGKKVAKESDWWVWCADATIEDAALK